jgi:uncharacterized DUF497 family protein
LEYYWDETKRARVLAERGIDFPLLAFALFDGRLVLTLPTYGESEERYITIGPVEGKAAPLALPAAPSEQSAPSVSAMRKVMTLNVGLERDEPGLVHALGVIGKMEKAGASDPDLRNMTAACLLIAACALRRKESRGGHYRTDYPKTEPAWASRTFVTLKQTREIAEAALKDTRPTTKPADNACWKCLRILQRAAKHRAT